MLGAVQIVWVCLGVFPPSNYPPPFLNYFRRLSSASCGSLPLGAPLPALRALPGAAAISPPTLLGGLFGFSFTVLVVRPWLALCALFSLSQLYLSYHIKKKICGS